jgi:hypothetical protein
MRNLKDSSKLFMPLFKSKEDMLRYQRSILLKCCIKQSIPPIDIEIHKGKETLQKIEFILTHISNELDLNSLNELFVKNEPLSEFKDDETAISFHQTNIFNTCLTRKQYPEQIKKISYIYAEYCGFYNINFSIDYLKNNNMPLLSNESLQILTKFLKTTHQQLDL